MAKKQKKVNKTNKSKQNKRIDGGNSDYKNQTRRIITCLITILVIFGVMYLITVLILNNSDHTSSPKEQTSIQYEEILLGTVFNKKDKEYLVLFYNVAYDTENTYRSLISDYAVKDNKIPLYYVDLNNSMNKSCISTETNKEATKAQDLKINDNTLIKFSNHKIAEYIVGEEEISNYLNK